MDMPQENTKRKIDYEKMVSMLKLVSIYVVNAVFILIEVLFLLSLIILFGFTIMLLIDIVFTPVNIFENWFVTSSYFNSQWIEIFESKKVELFGVFATITLVPLVSFIVSIVFHFKNSNEKISEQFSKSDGISLYCTLLPLGAWNDLVMHLNSKKPLLDYDYCLSLAFKNEVFQAYELDIIGIEVDGKQIDDFEKIVMDNTGISFNGEEYGKTQLSVVFDAEKIQGYDIEKLDKIVYNIHLKQRRYGNKEAKDNCFGRNKTTPFVNWFFITRMFYRWLVASIQKYRYYSVELNISQNAITKNNAEVKIMYPIYDINIVYNRKILGNSNLHKEIKKGQ